jgi:hypothetical protein
MDSAEGGSPAQWFFPFRNGWARDTVSGPVARNQQLTADEMLVFGRKPSRSGATVPQLFPNHFMVFQHLPTFPHIGYFGRSEHRKCSTSWNEGLYNSPRRRRTPDTSNVTFLFPPSDSWTSKAARAETIKAIVTCSWRGFKRVADLAPNPRPPRPSPRS